ncbi:MAG: hypothetical protein C0434_08080 [Xanthomonadaceae bacterium]|nr:hypothetical protein [Xanthomonadaceae bacterium]
MEPQQPGITTIRQLTLVAVNEIFTRIRQRLDSLDRRTVQNPASADQVLALQKQVTALQIGAKTTTVVQQSSPTSTPPTTGTANIPEVTADPTAPTAGDAWVLRSVVHPAGTLQGFAGGFPLALAADQNRFDLSISTSEGTKRVQIA